MKDERRIAPELEHVLAYLESYEGIDICRVKRKKNSISFSLVGLNRRLIFGLELGELVLKVYNRLADNYHYDEILIYQGPTPDLTEDGKYYCSTCDLSEPKYYSKRIDMFDMDHDLSTIPQWISKNLNLDTKFVLYQLGSEGSSWVTVTKDDDFDKEYFIDAFCPITADYKILK